METNNLTKLLLKITDTESGLPKWVHLCYIPETLLEAYKTQKDGSFTDFNATLSRWAKEDFGLDSSVTSAEEFEELKTKIKSYYKETYPDIYLDQSTDRQGWMRVWITKKLREELGIGE